MKGKQIGAIDDEGFVTPDSLSKYVYNTIMSLPPEKRPTQKPVRKVEESGDIVLAYYAALIKSGNLAQKNVAELKNQSEGVPPTNRQGVMKHQFLRRNNYRLFGTKVGTHHIISITEEGRHALHFLSGDV